MGIHEDPVGVWLATPFPHGSMNDALDELHADLVTVDTLIAGSVLRYRDTGHWIPPVPDVAGELARLRVDISATTPASSEEMTLLSSYLEYVDLLTEVYRTFLAKE